MTAQPRLRVVSEEEARSERAFRRHLTGATAFVVAVTLGGIVLLAWAIATGRAL